MHQYHFLQTEYEYEYFNLGTCRYGVLIQVLSNAITILSILAFCLCCLRHANFSLWICSWYHASLVQWKPRRHSAFVWGHPRLSAGTSTCSNKPMPKRKTLSSTLNTLAINKPGTVARSSQRVSLPKINQSRLCATMSLKFNKKWNEKYGLSVLEY